MTIAFNTFLRPDKNYLGKALNSLGLMPDDTRLQIYCGGDHDHVPQAYLSRLTSFHESPEQPPRERAARMIVTILEANEDEDILLCEDDVFFARGALGKLKDAISSVPVVDFVLSAFWPGPLRDPVIQHCNEKMWFGSQAIYFPRHLRGDAADFVRRQIQTGCGAFYSTDLALAQWCRANRVALFATNPSLAQHIGTKSVCSPWLMNNPPKSPTFQL